MLITRQVVTVLDGERTLRVGVTGLPSPSGWYFEGVELAPGEEYRSRRGGEVVVKFIEKDGDLVCTRRT